MGQIPPTFVGTPQALAEAMIRRTKIVSPSGTNFIYIGDVEPTSNVGPWLKDGIQWYVYSTDLKRYVPLNISASERVWFQIQNSVPTTSSPPIWLKTTHDPTDSDPSYGSPISWYVFNGSQWVPYSGVVESGTTAQRPASPVEYQQYYDTTISTLIWFERSIWRTVAGVPGDVKHVAFEVLTDALAQNPGWALFGQSNQSFRGRWFSQATKDPGASPATDLTTDPGVAHRAAFEVYGTDLNLTVTAGTVPCPPPTMALWTLVKL